MTTTARVQSPYLTSREAVAYLHAGSLSNLYRLIREYRLPYCRCGQSYRFDTRELDVWLRKHRQELRLVESA